MIMNIFCDYKIFNCEVFIWDENCIVDDFIDVIMVNYCKYIKCFYVYNKIDFVFFDFFDKFVWEFYMVVMFCELDFGI